ncbi:hypothetical protein [Kitasatospora sp. NPDC056531]|uniref:hypothetical protein n=1 Tax=Kitasatospora sp. NPDC056531 TaxID=3345856 RepID=UPI00367C3D98
MLAETALRDDAARTAALERTLKTPGYRVPAGPRAEAALTETSCCPRKAGGNADPPEPLVMFTARKRAALALTLAVLGGAALTGCGPDGPPGRSAPARGIPVGGMYVRPGHARHLLHTVARLDRLR